MAHHLACPRVRIAECPAKIPQKWIEFSEHNQWLATCCRNPMDNGTIEAWYSCEDQRDKREPDIYIFRCECCGRAQYRLCTGGNPTTPDAIIAMRQMGKDFQYNPGWEIR